MATWESAEAVAAAYLGAPQRQIEVARRLLPWPHLLWMYDESLEEHAYVLVHQGHVVTERGVDALGRYLQAVSALDALTSDAEQLLELIEALDAYPPVDDEPGLMGKDGYHFETDVFPDLVPRLETLPGGGWALTLHYERLASGFREDDGPLVGARRGPRLVDMLMCRLSIDKRYRCTWTLQPGTHPAQ